MTGRTLIQASAWMESWAAFRTRASNGLVLDEPDWRGPMARTLIATTIHPRPFSLYSGEGPAATAFHLWKVVVRVGNEVSR